MQSFPCVSWCAGSLRPSLNRLETSHVNISIQCFNNESFYFNFIVNVHFGGRKLPGLHKPQTVFEKNKRKKSFLVPPILWPGFTLLAFSHMSNLITPFVPLMRSEDDGSQKLPFTRRPPECNQANRHNPPVA